MKNGNLTKWLLGVLTTIGITWVIWVSAGVVQASVDGATLKQIADDVKEIKQAMRGGRRDR